MLSESSLSFSMLGVLVMYLDILRINIFHSPTLCGKWIIKHKSWLVKCLLWLLQFLSELLRKDCNRFFLHSRRAIVAEMQSAGMQFQKSVDCMFPYVFQEIQFGFQDYSVTIVLSNTVFGWEFDRYQSKACQDSAGQILVLEYAGNKNSTVKMMRPVSLLAF